MLGEITVPTEGRQTSETDSAELIGLDSNAMVIMATAGRMLRNAGASRGYVEDMRRQAMSGDYDHLLAVVVAFLEARP